MASGCIFFLVVHGSYIGVHFVITNLGLTYLWYFSVCRMYFLILNSVLTVQEREEKFYLNIIAVKVMISEVKNKVKLVPPFPTFIKNLN